MAIDNLEAAERMRAIQVSSYPHLKNNGDQKKIFSELKSAVGKNLEVDRKPQSIEALAKLLAGKA